MFRANAPAVAISLPAITSTGAIVQVEAKVFLDILARADHPLVVEYHKTGLLGSEHKYLTPYKGLYFYTEAKDPLVLPKEIESIVAGQIWIPTF